MGGLKRFVENTPTLLVNYYSTTHTNFFHHFEMETMMPFLNDIFDIAAW